MQKIEQFPNAGADFAAESVERGREAIEVMLSELSDVVWRRRPIVNRKQIFTNGQIGPTAERHDIKDFGNAKRLAQGRFHRRLARAPRANERAIDIEEECGHSTLHIKIYFA